MSKKRSLYCCCDKDSGCKEAKALRQKVLGVESRFKAHDESPEEFWPRVERLRVTREASDRPYKRDEHLGTDFGYSRSSREELEAENAAVKEALRLLTPPSKVIEALRQKVAEADTRYNEREAYLETMIEAFMIQYGDEGVSEASVAAAFAAREASDG